MKQIIALLAMAVMAASCTRVDNPPAAHHEAEKKTDGAFIHISEGADEPHDVLMALMLADKFSTSNDVLVFFDKDGIDMVVENAPNLEMDPFDASDEVFARLLASGAEILACPACLKVSGYSEADLRDGVKIAEKERFFDFTEGRILSLDY